MLCEIKDCLFVADSENSTYSLKHDVVAENSRHYYGAGLIFGENYLIDFSRLHDYPGTQNCFSLTGYSMLQGGPLPCCLNEDLLSKLFVNPATEGLTNAETQLREGLSKFSLVEVLCI